MAYKMIKFKVPISREFYNAKLADFTAKFMSLYPTEQFAMEKALNMAEDTARKLMERFYEIEEGNPKSWAVLGEGLGSPDPENGA
jgi:hypothetical protein